MAKPSAFLPNPKNGTTSVFRHGSEPRDALWEIGTRHLGESRSLHGAAILTARDVRSVSSLEVLAEEPPPRHADIVGWARSDADPELAKAQRKEQAALLAGASTLVKRQRNS